MVFLSGQYMKTFYENYQKNLAEVRKKLSRPLTYAEKILYTHLANFDLNSVKIGSAVELKVDRVIMQDATAQMAVLQFMNAGKSKVQVPTTIHCDHLIQAKVGAERDLNQAELENNEVYAFLKSAANKFGMGFWKPGSGIIHQVVLENYALPGMLMIGTDSHTPNAGGVGALAIGVGGADAVEAMAGEAWKVIMPKLIGIELKGKLNGWTAPKDIILKVAEILTVKGGTGCIIEYFGEGARSLSATGKATITNMGAEIGATTSLFPYDIHTEKYLRATRRMDVVESANSISSDLAADVEVEVNPMQYFSEVIIIDLSQLEPQVVGPHTPDLARKISELGLEVKEKGWPVELKYGLIGSCTNSSYQDMCRAASVAQQAYDKGLVVKSGFLITPGSEQIYQTIKRDGFLEIFEKIGGVVLANACGPCIGQWSRDDIKTGEANTIISSYNRNFRKRNDANPETLAFIASPEIVMALAIAGRLDFNPLTDELDAADGTKFKLEVGVGKELPEEGFVFDSTGYSEASGEGQVLINKNSSRLALLAPFNAVESFEDLWVLLKVKGKCTTDHISPAGKWLKYRGHLDKISDNMFSGAVNSFSEESGKGRNLLSGEVEEFSKIARDYKKNHKNWIVIGDYNYGEGSSREQAAMEPRYLGCAAVVVKSFARIHETNLKKQGLLPLTFVDVKDYDKILEEDKVSIIGADNLQVGVPVILNVTHSDGLIDAIETRHTLTEEEIAWFKAGSMLEWIKKR
jgi:aconitate hydratase